VTRAVFPRPGRPASTNRLGPDTAQNVIQRGQGGGHAQHPLAAALAGFLDRLCARDRTLGEGVGLSIGARGHIRHPGDESVHQLVSRRVGRIDLELVAKTNDGPPPAQFSQVPGMVVDVRQRGFREVGQVFHAARVFELAGGPQILGHRQRVGRLPRRCTAAQAAPQQPVSVLEEMILVQQRCDAVPVFRVGHAAGQHPALGIRRSQRVMFLLCHQCAPRCRPSRP